MASKEKAELFLNRSDYRVAEARYPNMSNVRAQNARRSPRFERCASLARHGRSPSWKKRAARRKN